MFLALTTAWLLAAAGQQERPQPDRRALLVGIGDYGGPDSAWEKLYGPPNDVALIRDLIVGRFGFAAERVQTLVDAEATHAAVVDAFWNHLIRGASPGTEAFFYFSGHGSTAGDASGLEPDGLDSTLVTFDSARGAAGAVSDLTDDELTSLLVALAATGARVTVVTDCCHAGGLMRGESAARSLPAAAPAEDPGSFLPPEVPLLEDGDPRRPETLPWVFVAACQPQERAHERKVEDDRGDIRSHGLMTWQLAAALREAPADSSWERVTERVAAAIQEELWREGARATQRPALAGPAQRVVFGGGYAPPLPGLPARAHGDRGFLKVGAGSLHFLEPGTRLEVLGLDGAPLGFAVVHPTRVWPTRCEARWEGSAPDGIRAGDALRVRPLDAPASAPPVALHAPEGEEPARSLAGCLREGSAVLTGPDEAQLLLRPGEGGGWRALDAAGGYEVFAWDPGAARVEERLAEMLRQERRYRRWMAHPRSDARGGITLEWRPVDAARLAQLEEWSARDCAAAALRGEPSGANARVAVRGAAEAAQIVDLVVRVPEGPGAAGGHLTVLCVSEDRSVTPIHPADGDPGRALAPGQEIAIPVEVFVPESWPRGLAQRDRYVALLTEEPLPAALFRERALALRGGGPVPPRLLALREVALRGGAEARLAAAAPDFSFACADLLLERE